MKTLDQPRRKTAGRQNVIYCRDAFEDCVREATHMRESFVHSGKWFAVCAEHSAYYKSIGIRIRKITDANKIPTDATGAKNHEKIHHATAV